jgi:hypothetical protein
MFSCLGKKLTGSLRPSIHQQSHRLLRKQSQKKDHAFVDSTKISNSVPSEERGGGITAYLAEHREGKKRNNQTYDE